ncbi:MAG: hypothetical protein E6J91_40130, partial [Deltaproteobacteria bacterium]
MPGAASHAADQAGRNTQLLAQLARVSLAEREALLRGLIEARLGAFLGWPEARRLAPDQRLLALGIDSLRAVDFKILLETELGCALRTSLLFDHPTLEALAHHLVHALGEPPPEAVGAPAPAAPASDGHAPAGPDVGVPRIGEMGEMAQMAQMSEPQLLGVLRAASARLAAIEAARSEPIAVVGIGCRFPGGATTAEQFWQLQLDAIDAITEVPPQRWELSAFHDPDPAAPGKMIARHGGFLGDLALFDAAFFGISAREATQMDPQQRLLLECAWEALEHGGQSPRQLAGAPVGVFIGSGIAEYAWSRHGVSLDRVGPYFSVGESISMVSGRVAYSLGLTGPALTLDTACSSSLVAVHLACEAIRRGECRAALAGGVNLMIIPRISVALSKAEMLSHDGRCKTFSAAANGYVRAEGCGVIHLKRLSDARRDGDRVLAVVRGSAVNQDGASAGLTAPSGPAQEAVIRRALQAGG